MNASHYIRGKAEDLRLRRLARYLASEQALAESFRHCGFQQLPDELHLEALKKSASILNALAADAKDAVDRLRTLLANRSAEPTLYKSIQRQRWMEERRHDTFDQLSKTLRTELARLSSSTNIGQTLTLEPSNSNSNTNLDKFFESSRRRILIPSRNRRRIPNEQLKDSRIPTGLQIPRIHHENYIIPLVLKSPRRRRFFPSYTSQASQDHSSSSSSVENVSSTPSTVSDASNLETIADDNEEILLVTLPVNYNQDDTNGTALIWRDVPRSKEEILAELHVSMPDYVADLLADFESTSRPSSITLSPHTRSRLDSSPPTPRKPIHKSRSRHRLSTLFSGIPVPFASRLANANIIGGDTTKASRVRPSVQPGIESIIEGPSRPIATALSDFNLGNSGSQASDTEEEKIIVRIKRRISNLGRT